MKSLRRALQILFWAALLLLASAFLIRDQLPAKRFIHSEVKREPVQVETTIAPFQVEMENTTYTVSPLYTYDIAGLIVSEHRTDALFDYYHDLWGDSLNVKDVCVMWGNNAVSGIYDKMEFKSGSATCYVKTNDPEAMRTFNITELSNNHLLTTSPEIQKVLKTVRRGDQIQITGYLAEYSHDGGFSRGSSINRTDIGNGACETVYVTGIRVLREDNVFAKRLFSFSLYLLSIIIIFRIVLFFVYITRQTERLQEMKQ